MRVLVFLRGLPGSGKSTFVRENHLEDFTVSTDSIVQLFGSNCQTSRGIDTINLEVSGPAWKFIHELLEFRFKNGCFTIFDATNIKGADIKKVANIAKKYRYRLYCVDFTNVSKEECIRRNRNRLGVKKVDDSVIERMYNQLQNNKVPGGIKVINPSEFKTELFFRTTDLSSYKKVHHIGDIHACYTALQNYLNGPLKDDEFYIFLGDFLDRGIENVDNLRFIASIANKPNVLLLEGNHEKHLVSYLNDEIASSSDFELYTKIELDLAGSDEMKELCKVIISRLNQCFIYKWGNKTVLCTHGGLSRLPSNLMYVNSSQLIKGVGLYQDMIEVNESFERQNKDRQVYQVHGHRNVEQVPIRVNSRCFNLCEHIEYGGNLRSLILDKDGFHEVYTKNPVYKEKDSNAPITDVGELLDNLQNNEYIKSVRQEGTNVFSYNFTRKAFNNGIWDDITVKARGLFINEKLCEIVARGYNKFFNINERPETNLDVLPNTLKYPVTVYKKENGFLGLLGYDPETDSILYCSKSLASGMYSDYFRKLILDSVNEDILLEYFKNNKVTLLFEVIDIENDPHIIEYRKSRVILLDIVENTVQFKHRDYLEVQELAKKWGLDCKEKCYEIKNEDEFKALTSEILKDNYRYNGKHIEGFVFEDSSGFMFKFKTMYYKFWKIMRSQVEAIANGRVPKVKDDFLDWVEEDMSRCIKSIIYLRKEYQRCKRQK